MTTTEVNNEQIQTEVIKEIDNSQVFWDKAYNDYKEYEKNLWKIPINIWQQLLKPQRIV